MKKEPGESGNMLRSLGKDSWKGIRESEEGAYFGLRITRIVGEKKRVQRPESLNSRTERGRGLGLMGRSNGNRVGIFGKSEGIKRLNVAQDFMTNPGN